MIRHLLAQPFVFATGLAALVHSTWSLGTFISGEQPADMVKHNMDIWAWIRSAL